MSASSSRSHDASSAGSNAATCSCSVRARRDLPSESRNRPRNPRCVSSLSAGTSESPSSCPQLLGTTRDVRENSAIWFGSAESDCCVTRRRRGGTRASRALSSPHPPNTQVSIPFAREERHGARLTRCRSGGGGDLFVARQAPRDDLRDAVVAHRHAVEHIGRLHRALLVRDHDELRTVGVRAQELREATDVRVVERCLDLVEEVERARPREEEREQERDRAEGLLAARQKRQARDALPGRAQLDLDPGLLVLLLRLGQPEPPLAAGEERCGHLAEVLLDRRERLGEAGLDRPCQVVAELLELVEALLQVGALHRELLEPLLLGVVFLLRERIDLAELLAALLRARELLGELVAVLALRRLGRGGVEPPLCLVVLGIRARQLDVDGRQPLAGG